MLKNKTAAKLNILVFHKIVGDKVGEWADVKLALFTQLLKTANANNQVIVSISDWAENNSGELAFSFDDGHCSDFDIVLPLLQEYGAQGTFFVTPNYVGKNGYMSWEQIKALGEAGMEIGSHSLSHPYMTTLSTEQLLIELKDSKAQIEQHTGKEIVSFAYPFGDCFARTHKVAKEVGYKNICTSKPGLCKSKMNNLNRNSVHSNINSDQLDQLLNPSTRTIFKKQTAYSIRYGLKRVLGVNNYIKLRNSIYS
jgi:peptidoglycan/xylan/chitin deacetylase (PgdA/CDA1 family)